MVEFFDPLANENISYHIDAKLKAKWDLLRGGKLQDLNEDRVYLVDGRERTGKSSFAFQQAKYIDPTFNVDRICFTPEQFLYNIKHTDKGGCVVYDEAFRGLSSKASRSKVNKAIVEALMEVGQKNLVIFIVLPTIFLLEIYAAVFRSECLFHIYKLKKKGDDTKRLRAFKIYNYYKKKQLYLRGRVKYFSYFKPKIKRAKGQFYVNKTKAHPTGVPYSTFEIEAYLKKKEEAFASGDKEEKEESKYKIQRDLIIRGVYEDFVKTQSALSDWLEGKKVGLTQKTISNLFANLAKIEKDT